jgi:hypothetical protein
MKTKYFEALFRIQLVHGEHACKALVIKKISNIFVLKFGSNSKLL